MKDCRIAVAQIKVSDPKTNTNKVIKYIRKASKKDADLVIFPEASIYVYPEDKPDELLDYLKLIKNACKGNSIWCILTSYAIRKGKKYNTAFLIDRNGRIVYTYDKKHLYGDEKRHVTPGKFNRVISTEFGKIGIIICLDIAFPEEIKELSSRGAWIIFCPTYEIDWESDDVPKALPLVRAYENACYFVVCDACNKDTLSISSISDPRKMLKCIIKKEGLIVQNLDYAKIKRLRASKEVY